MKVFPVNPRGYCKGVVEAIRIAQSTRLQYPDKNIYILGMIVHNEHVVNLLQASGIHTIHEDSKTRLELLDSVNDGVVILTAHGTSQAVIDKANSKHLIVVDGTCKDVTSTHVLVEKYIHEGYDIIYIGKKNHPESEATLSLNESKIHLIESSEDVAQLQIYNPKILLTNQTTMSFLDIEEIAKKCQSKFPSLIISKEVCHATQVRQEAILSLPHDIDLVIVAGDKRSNNSNRLVQLAKQRNIESYLIEDISNLDVTWLKSKHHVAITAGASTPTYLVNTIINFLREYDETDVSTHQPKPEHYAKESL